MIEDMEIARPDGRIQLQVWGAPILDSEGNVANALVAFSNITAQKRFEEALRESETRFRAIFEESPLGIFLVDIEGRFIRVNEALCQITGYGSDELLGRCVAEITFGDDVDVGLAQKELLASGQITHFNVEKRYVRKDGRIVWVGVHSCAILNTRGVPIHWLAMAEDITARREMEAAVQQLADHDPLTGLPNRRLMYEHMEQAITHTRRYGGEIAILSIDLNDFKNVNDEFGHAAGDALLVEISRRLESAIRESDTAARMGGDEFLVLLTEAPPADVEAVRLRIRGALAQPVVYEGHDLFTPASIGVATYGLDGRDLESLLKAADGAMYADKEAHSAITGAR
jgi:diguanylate cyclase (GGDEF)-like protein/PAS domain S-box-containing protein